MASVSSEVDQQHRSLLIKLCEMMNPDDPKYQNFILYLQSYVPKERLLSVQKNPTAVFNLMEERGILRVGEYRALEEALNASRHIDILNVLKNGEKSIAPRQMRKRSYRDGPMADDSSNIETVTTSSIEPGESQKNISRRKIGKQKGTVNITEAKLCNFVFGDKSHSVINMSSLKEVPGVPVPAAESNPLDEDISKIRDHLIKMYRNLRCVQVSPIYEMTRRDMDDIYVDIVIEEKQDSRKTDEESRYVSTQSENTQSYSKKVHEVTSYNQIFFDEGGSKFKRVCLRGKGGLGKTTFCRKVLHAWCNAHEGRGDAHSGSFKDETVLQMFDILFYMSLREVSDHENLIDAICDNFSFLSHKKNVLQSLLYLIGDKVLLILDGLDEVNTKDGFIENVLIRRDYPNCCFLVSSRPWKISKMGLQVGYEIELLLDLQGFSERNAIQFAENIFKKCHSDGNVIQQFEKAIDSNKVAKQLIHVPLLLVFLAHCWYEKRSLPSKIHELYISFLNMMADRMKEKYKIVPNYKQINFTRDVTQSTFPSKLSETHLVKNFGEGFLLSLCGVAHQFLLSNQKENSLVFEETKLLNALGDRGKEILDVSLELGLLSVTDSVSYNDRKLSVSFLHKTMQEFFTAACFILSPDKLTSFISSIADLNDVQQNENIIVFLVGLKPKLGNRVLERVNELYRNDWEVLRSGMDWERNRFKLFQPERVKSFYVSTIYLRCKEEVSGKEVKLNVSRLHLQEHAFDLHPWNPALLQMLDLIGPHLEEMRKPLVVDLRGLKGLTYIALQGLTCESLYLPESGSLSVLLIKSVTLSSGCCDVLGRTLTHCTKLTILWIRRTDLHECLLDLSNMKELIDLDIHRVTLSRSCCDVLCRTLVQCTKLYALCILNIDLHSYLLNLSNMIELTTLDILGVKLSSSCCDELGSSLTHCTKLEILCIQDTNLHNCLLDLTNMTGLTNLDISGVALSSSCCDKLGSSLAYCTKLDNLSIQFTNLHNCHLDFSKMTELTNLYMNSVTLSSSCCDILGRTLAHCTKLKKLRLHKTDLHNCRLDLSNMAELTNLDMSAVTLSSSCCNELGRTLTYCAKLENLSIEDLSNCQLDLSNMTELIEMDMSRVTLSSSCELLGRTQKQCTKLKKLTIYNTDLHNCLLDLSNMTELTELCMLGVTLSSSCCDELGRTLKHCTKLKKFKIHNIDLHNCLLDLTGMMGLTDLDMSGVTLSSSCCDELGRTLTHCTKLKKFKIHNSDLHNCRLDLTRMTELTELDMSGVTLSSSCCDELGRTLTHCTKLKTLNIHNTDLHNCQLDFSNMTELTSLDMLGVTLSSSCCDELGRTLTHCTKLKTLNIHNTDLHNCQLDFSNMTELTSLDMLGVTLSSSCCDVLGRTLTHCTNLWELSICNTDLHSCMLKNPSNMMSLIFLTLDGVSLSSSACQELEQLLDQLKTVNNRFSKRTFEKSPCDNDKWKVKLC